MKWWGPHPPAGPTTIEARAEGARGDIGCSPHFALGVNPECGAASRDGDAG
ncbi:MAG: hypothetical protein K0R97_1596 [Oerskovia sp.]|jgi:hypothetical protein|nr:hypothetical protein [Oerskovia sp.]